MIDPAVLRAMLNAGCTADQIVAVAEEAARADDADKTTRLDRRREVSGREWYALRGAAMLRDGFKCTYCGSEGDGFPLECDHIVPLCQGGSFDLENLTTACKSCNSSKRHRTPEQWRGEA